MPLAASALDASLIESEVNKSATMLIAICTAYISIFIPVIFVCAVAAFFFGLPAASRFQSFVQEVAVRESRGEDAGSIYAPGDGTVNAYENEIYTRVMKTPESLGPEFFSRALELQKELRVRMIVIPSMLGVLFALYVVAQLYVGGA